HGFRPFQSICVSFCAKSLIHFGSRVFVSLSQAECHDFVGNSKAGLRREWYISCMIGELGIKEDTQKCV
ncbi:MAG: hypothetical protein AAF582_14335, partial [Pseudomonadota bacterium]